MRKWILVWMLALLFCGSALAEPSNSGFETGDFTDWTELCSATSPNTCSVAVTTDAARYGTYGAELHAYSDGSDPSDSQHVALRSETVVIPWSVTRVIVTFLGKFDGDPPGNGHCYIQIFQADSDGSNADHRGSMQLGENYTSEYDEDMIIEEDDHDLMTGRYRSWQFDSTIDGNEGDYVMVKPGAYVNDDSIECHLDNVEITFGT